MAENNEQRKYLHININERILSVIVFSFLFAWLLAFPFEGHLTAHVLIQI
jgi:hypothetical protein